ncbi:MAG: hypothetical protein U5K71_11075 [Gracilimonas sp.]|nr:hypothetical protein [Gracilimonas sp.]
MNLTRSRDALETMHDAGSGAKEGKLANHSGLFPIFREMMSLKG